MTNKFLTWADGKKTYITVGLGIALGVAQGLGFHAPSWIDWVLGFAGLGFHRSALTNAVSAQSQAATQALEAVVQTVLTQIEVQPAPVSAVAVGQTVTVDDTPVVIGQPTPKGLDEQKVTDALNAAQIAGTPAQLPH